MKLKVSSRQDGGILVVTLVIASLVGIMLASYLKMVSSQNSYTFRSQVWNSGIPLCEAGVEEAMAHLNSLRTNTSFAANGWAPAPIGYVKERSLEGGSYRAIIDTNFPPIITVLGRVPAPMQTSRYITRTVRVKTKWNRRFPHAILSKGRIDLGGTSSRIDSFISTNATDGQYNILNARDEAPVACMATAPGNFYLGNTKIYGRAGISAGGDVTMGSSGAVGDQYWVPSNVGIQPGRLWNDLNFYVPDVTFPSPFGPVFTPSGRTVNGVAYKYVFDDGDYRLSNFTLGAGERALVLGKARLHVEGQTSVGGAAAIEIATNADMVVYAGGNVSISGLGVINLGGYARNLSINGLTNCTSIVYSGSSKFIGTIYAPQADVRISGTTDTVGAVVANRFDFNGGFQFHYDESLQGRAETGPFLVASWIEL